MARSPKSAREAGTRFATEVARFLAFRLHDDRIERRAPSGAKDRGDIAAVRTITGGRVVIECKDHAGKVLVGPWLNEAEVERGNDDAVVGVVIAKRRGIADPGEQIVLMTVEAFARLLEGGIDTDHGVEFDPHTRAVAA
jgi:hypothetical protein